MHVTRESTELDPVLEAIRPTRGNDFRQCARASLERRLAGLSAQSDLTNLSEITPKILPSLPAGNSLGPIVVRHRANDTGTMPLAAIRAVEPHHVLDLKELGKYLERLGAEHASSQPSRETISERVEG